MCCGGGRRCAPATATTHSPGRAVGSLFCLCGCRLFVVGVEAGEAVATALVVIVVGAGCRGAGFDDVVEGFALLDRDVGLVHAVDAAGQGALHARVVEVAALRDVLPRQLAAVDSFLQLAEL